VMLANVPGKQKPCLTNHEMLVCQAGLSESVIRALLYSILYEKF
jgi:hypothetical protein